MGADLIAVVGPSGSGKSTSLRNLDPKTTVIISTTATKRLPFENKGFITKKVSEGGNLFFTSDSDQICSLMQAISDTRPEVVNIILEDLQYVMGFAYMAKARQAGYNKFSEIAEMGFKPLKLAETLRSNLVVACIYHDEEESNSSSKRKIKTTGEFVCL